MTTGILGALAAALLVAYLMRRRARLRSEEDHS